jgi:hypothetical protein
MASPPTGPFASPPLNDIALCREALRNVADARYKNIRLYLAGSVFFLYYEDRRQRPFASLVPKYTDLNVDATTKATQQAAEPISLPPKPILKRVIMERNDPANFDEIILKRTVFLEHIPNVYDKALSRAYETMMIDLYQSSPPLQAHVPTAEHSP